MITAIYRSVYVGGKNVRVKVLDECMNCGMEFIDPEVCGELFEHSHLVVACSECGCLCATFSDRTPALRSGKDAPKERQSRLEPPPKEPKAYV